MTEYLAKIRTAVRAAVPDGAFLRRDRGRMLFVTDAPRCFPDIDIAARLKRAGFDVEPRAGGLVAFAPDARWLQAFSDARPDPPDFFCASLRRFDGEPDAESLALFAEGLKALDARRGFSAFEKRLRQRAAVCLRRRAAGETIGGGLYACALLCYDRNTNEEGIP